MKRAMSIALLLSFLGTLGLTSAWGTAQDKKVVVVVIETSKGKIKAELYADKAPITVKNFLQYVDDKHYDGTIFHRVIPDLHDSGGRHGARGEGKEDAGPDQE